MIKYSVVAYIILAFLFLFELNQAVTAKNVLEKKVKGISTQVKEIEKYQNEVSSFNAGY